MQKPRLLCVEPFPPYPLTSGGHQAIYNGLKAVGDMFDVYIYYNLWLDEGQEDNITPAIQTALPKARLLPRINRREKIKVNRIKLILWNFKQWVLNHFTKRGNGYTDKSDILCSAEHTLSYFKPKDRDEVDFINRLICNNNIDIVQIEMLPMMSLGYSLPSHIKKVFVHHELFFVRRELELKERTNFGLYEQGLLEISKDLEVSTLNRYDAIITLSKRDADKLAVAGVRKKIYPSIAVIDGDANTDPSLETNYELVYIGPETHNPNYEAIVWFLANCWRKLREIDYRFRLKVIGVWYEDTVKRLTSEYENIHFTGYVENLEPELRNTTMIVPLTVGSGVRMKILEAATRGIPFVTTSIGAEGLAFENGKDCFIADTPSDFVEAVQRIQDTNTRSQFIQNAQKVILDNYSLDALKKDRESIYKGIIKDMQK